LIMDVLEFPPKLLSSSWVNFESLNGTNVLSDIFFPASLLTTLLRAERAVFIFDASFNRSPVAPVCLTHLDPAKSTMFRWATLVREPPSLDSTTENVFRRGHDMLREVFNSFSSFSDLQFGRAILVKEIPQFL